MEPTAKILLDSVSPDGARLTTMEVVMHRFVLAEFNTHRVFCLAGDSMLEFDLPGGSRGSRRVFYMPIAEFVDKWHNGAAPRKSKPRKDGTQGTNRQPIRDRLAAMRIRQLNEDTGDIQTSTVVDAIFSGRKEVFEVRAGDFKIAGSRDHLVMTTEGYSRIEEIVPGVTEVVVRKFGKRDDDLTDPMRLKKIDGQWRSVFQRKMREKFIDMYGGCQDCGSEVDLCIHHTISVHERPDLAFEESNLELLCEGCHKTRHRVQGWQGGTYLYGASAVVDEVVSRGEEDTYDLSIAGAYPNFIANGVVVHNSRNSASSRAIPFPKVVARVRTNPAVPLVWAAEQKGMQGGDEVEETANARAAWLQARDEAVHHAKYLAQLGVHKSIVNRLLEPFMWHTVIVSSTEWQNFFEQRCSPLAQPEIRAAADAMRDELEASTPVPLDHSDWHTPLIVTGDLEDAHVLVNYDEIEAARVLRRVSAARCARVSYLTHEGKRDLLADLELYDRLVSAKPAHWSPLEHVATPCRPEPHGHQGNFAGWDQLRHVA